MPVQEFLGLGLMEQMHHRDQRDLELQRTVEVVGVLEGQGVVRGQFVVGREG